MSQTLKLDMLKEIPGYKVILRALIKTQIQHLVEQLSEQTAEESVVLSANISEGTLMFLGSEKARGFYEGRDEVKAQFLGYCMRKHQRSGSSQPQSGLVFERECKEGPPPKKQKLYSLVNGRESQRQVRQGDPRKCQKSTRASQTNFQDCLRGQGQQDTPIWTSILHENEAGDNIINLSLSPLSKYTGKTHSARTALFQEKDTVINVEDDQDISNGLPQLHTSTDQRRKIQAVVEVMDVDSPTPSSSDPVYLTTITSTTTSASQATDTNLNANDPTYTSVSTDSEGHSVVHADDTAVNVCSDSSNDTANTVLSDTIDFMPSDMNTPTLNTSVAPVKATDVINPDTVDVSSSTAGSAKSFKTRATNRNTKLRNGKETHMAVTDVSTGVQSVDTDTTTIDFKTTEHADILTVSDKILEKAVNKDSLLTLGPNSEMTYKSAASLLSGVNTCTSMASVYNRTNDTDTYITSEILGDSYSRRSSNRSLYRDNADIFDGSDMTVSYDSDRTSSGKNTFTNPYNLDIDKIPLLDTCSIASQKAPMGDTCSIVPSKGAYRMVSGNNCTVTETDMENVKVTSICPRSDTDALSTGLRTDATNTSINLNKSDSLKTTPTLGLNILVDNMDTNINDLPVYIVDESGNISRYKNAESESMKNTDPNHEIMKSITGEKVKAEDSENLKTAPAQSVKENIETETRVNEISEGGNNLMTEHQGASKCDPVKDNAIIVEIIEAAADDQADDTPSYSAPTFMNSESTSQPVEIESSKMYNRRKGRPRKRQTVQMKFLEQSGSVPRCEQIAGVSESTIKKANATDILTGETTSNKYSKILSKDAEVSDSHSKDSDSPKVYKLSLFGIKSKNTDLNNNYTAEESNVRKVTKETVFEELYKESVTSSGLKTFGSEFLSKYPVLNESGLVKQDPDLHHVTQDPDLHEVVSPIRNEQTSFPKKCLSLKPDSCKSNNKKHKSEKSKPFSIIKEKNQTLSSDLASVSGKSEISEDYLINKYKKSGKDKASCDTSFTSETDCELTQYLGMELPEPVATGEKIIHDTDGTDAVTIKFEQTHNADAAVESPGTVDSIQSPRSTRAKKFQLRKSFKPGTETVTISALQVAKQLKLNEDSERKLLSQGIKVSAKPWLGSQLSQKARVQCDPIGEAMKAGSLFRCEFCGKFFMFKSQYELHLVTHTNEKKFECGICRKRFKLKHQLVRHMTIVHNK